MHDVRRKETPAECRDVPMSVLSSCMLPYCGVLSGALPTFDRHAIYCM